MVTIIYTHPEIWDKHETKYQMVQFKQDIALLDQQSSPIL